MIKFLSKKQFSKFISDMNTHNKQCDLFITYDNGKYVACDDSTGNKWVEEFDHLEKAISWLKGEFEL